MSLIEIVFSLGIVSFSILPLLGLLSIGCTGYRSAIQQSVQAEIEQQVRALAAGVTGAGVQIPTTYYRADGTATTANDASRLYEVVVQPAAAPNATSLAPSVLLANQLSIIHIPSGRTLATAVIHVTPRAPTLSPQQ